MYIYMCPMLYEKSMMTFSEDMTAAVLTPTHICACSLGNHDFKGATHPAYAVPTTGSNIFQEVAINNVLH